MADFTLKRNDTAPAMAVQLTDTVNGVTTPIDLTAATGVKLITRQQGAQTGTKTNAACSFVDRTTGKISYQWLTTDTDTDGLYSMEFQITWTGGAKETVPNDTIAANGGPYYVLEITKDLGD
jgi:hypothetical protein